jgi:hypothetical protein
VLRLGREDLLGAAAELDLAAGLEAGLATGLEVSQGRIGGELAPAALARALRSASGLRGTEVALSTPAWARYLALPAAVLAGILLLPLETGARTGRTTGLLGPAGAGGGARGGPVTAGEPRETEAAHIARSPAENVALLEEYREDAAAGRAPVRVPAGPPPRPARADGERASPAAAARGKGAGTGDGQGAAAPEESPPGPAARAAGPVDLGEAAAIRERFPEYEDIIGRYFAGL